MSDHVTGFYTKDGIKKYDYNSLANLPASVTDPTNTVISPNADFAEVGEWADGNPDKEDRLGYFVAIAEVGDNTIKIRKATSTDDVRGVSVYNPAFSGNASQDKYGEDGELLPQYNYIGIMGIVKMIDNGLCSVNGRCMPADDGTAIPSSNNMGYAVLKRVDSTHVLIAVEPGADMIQRVKSDVASGSGLTAEQAEMLRKFSAWYESNNYTKMTASISPRDPTYEMGSTVDVTFVWTFSEKVSAVTFNGGIQEPKQTGFTTITGIKVSGVYPVVGTRADGNMEEAKASTTITFLNRAYWGCAADPRDTGGTVDSAFIRILKNIEFATSRNKSFTANCPDGQYIWYAYPARFGKAQPQMAPAGSTLYFAGGFEDPLTVSVTNSSGYTENYYVYRSMNTGLNQEIKMT